MQTVTSCLVADGTSDRALVPIIQRALEVLATNVAFAQVEFPDCESSDLKARVTEVLSRYSCDILFVHRDAESQIPLKRSSEISAAVEQCAPALAVEVIPVKMTEAWLICDPRAIRSAVGNPHGTSDLKLPTLSKAEAVDAKIILDAALVAAAGLSSRRRVKFRPERYRFRVAELLPDRSKMLKLPSYAAFESALALALGRLHQNP